MWNIPQLRRSRNITRTQCEYNCAAGAISLLRSSNITIEKLRPYRAEFVFVIVLVRTLILVFCLYQHAQISQRRR